MTNANSMRNFADLIDQPMREAIEALPAASPLLRGMVEYHLGWCDADFQPTNSSVASGKRIRPLIALLAAEAVGGSAETAAPLGAAIELLHNFTLVHDDIQDRSPLRRHRPTVWSLWGDAQAINAGDALFAAAHHALYSLRGRGCPPQLVLDLASQFDAMTVEIVAGQVADLHFESRQHVTTDEYLEMISGKTAAILRFAAAAGARLGGATLEQIDAFAQFGFHIGTGFQIQDDLLGIWGDPGRTGKANGDDVRRRKKSLPVLMLRERASAQHRTWLEAVYSSEGISETDVDVILNLMQDYDIETVVSEAARSHHDLASDALDAALVNQNSHAAELLRKLVQQMSSRGA